MDTDNGIEKDYSDRKETVFLDEGRVVVRTPIIRMRNIWKLVLTTDVMTIVLASAMIPLVQVGFVSTGSRMLTYVIFIVAGVLAVAKTIQDVKEWIGELNRLVDDYGTSYVEDIGNLCTDIIAATRKVDAEKKKEDEQKTPEEGDCA